VADLDQPTWVFGYGSLIWRPDIPFVEAVPASLPGYVRRFWQGSHDHRGTPDQPGRVVTLIESPQARCAGMAYLLQPDVVQHTFERLDHREKNGYERFVEPLHLQDSRCVQGLVYIAPVNNFAYLGDAPLPAIARQIARSSGPSGRNIDYLTELAAGLRSLNAHDEHVFELESMVLAITDGE
jgi:cation transport regulator ChaC